MTGKTKVLSVHKFRRDARKRERRITLGLRIEWSGTVTSGDVMYGSGDALYGFGVPDWARGVRVEKAGPFQWAVVATEAVGR